MIKNRTRKAGNAINTCALCFHVLLKKSFMLYSPNSHFIDIFAARVLLRH